MSASPPSNSETKVPQRQKHTPLTRPRQGKFVSKKLAILATLIILVLGCASLPSLSAFWTLTQDESEGTEEAGEITSPDPDDLSARPAQPDSGQDVTEIVAIAELPPRQLEPTSTPTPTIIDTPTPSPTATSPPTATDTPTSTPTPSPTATSPPTATDTPTSTSTPTPSPTATSPPTATPTPMPTATPQPEIKYVVIISIDGLRPDALASAHTPTLDKLITRGTYCPVAQTILDSVTLPSHASMLSGMTPHKHGILWGTPYIGWPGMNGPTLFNVAHDAGLRTAMVFGKQKLNYLVLPDSVDELFGTDVHDEAVKDHALEYIQAGLSNVLFIHFPDTDRVGHIFGWMSSNQLQSVTFVDGLIGEVVAELESESYLDSTLLIITADHGGHGFGHGDDSPLDRTIPWLAVGPGVPAGVTLNRNINTYDTAATVLYALNLPIPEIWDGQPIPEIFP